MIITKNAHLVKYLLLYVSKHAYLYLCTIFEFSSSILLSPSESKLFDEIKLNGVKVFWICTNLYPPKYVNGSESESDFPLDSQVSFEL